MPRPPPIFFAALGAAEAVTWSAALALVIRLESPGRRVGQHWRPFTLFSHETLQYDLYYAKHVSLALDVSILLRRARHELSGRGR